MCVEVKGVYTKVAEFTRQTSRAAVSRVWGGGAVFYFTRKSKYIRTKGKRNSVSIDRSRVNSGQRLRTITACVLRSIFCFYFHSRTPFCACVCVNVCVWVYLCVRVCVCCGVRARIGIPGLFRRPRQTHGRIDSIAVP